MHLYFCAHLINILLFLGLLNLDIIPSEMLRGCLVFVICNSSSFYLFIYIQTMHYDCSHIEDVHLLFCADLIIFLGVLNVDIITSTPSL